jgi:hypothetical protein
MEYALTNFTIVTMTRRVEHALVIKDKVVARVRQEGKVENEPIFGELLSWSGDGFEALY